MVSDIARMLNRSIIYEQTWITHPRPNVAKNYLDSKASIDIPCLIKAVSRVAKYDFTAALWFATGGSKLFAVLRFLGEHTKIPVPTVHGYSVERDDGVPPFVVEQWIDAEPVWLRSLTLTELHSYGECLSQITKEWNNITFKEIGALYPCSSTYEIKSWGSEMQWFMPPFSAPVSSSVQAWYYSLIDTQIERLHSPQTSICQLKLPKFTTNQISFALHCYKDLRRWLATSEHFQQLGSSRLALIHPDLQSSNILVCRDGCGGAKIMAVIDWELAFAGPNYLFRVAYLPDVVRQFKEAWTKLSPDPVPPLFEIDDHSQVGKISRISSLHSVVTSGLYSFSEFFDGVCRLYRSWKDVEIGCFHAECPPAEGLER
ncbi:hypothetical protein DACRYDRAFT_117426 [Dacryopinax primogenitus]|uniref:Uncharacterized protein n=1 Tax=Dacryopinax primogenitus (strain DJM 731) TaxID=1858805 RepID=M5FXG2_DACPD|nr:uncharacterized protein DACRYDRAFT_117426 [Dacryopinax primogenitus]EJU00475.1 hypothetical protein DACRYDRAFT_117426 [Dacryopinax primogenitus]